MHSKYCPIRPLLSPFIININYEYLLRKIIKKIEVRILIVFFIKNRDKNGGTEHCPACALDNTTTDEQYDCFSKSVRGAF